MREKKTVLVTGAGSELGRALTVEAVRLGYAPLIPGCTLSSLQETARLAGLDDDSIVLADVARANDRAWLVAAVEGRLDVLINTVSCPSAEQLSDLDDAALHRMCDTNLAAPILLTRNMLPALRAARGQIVNISAMSGTYPCFAAYSAMKLGLSGFSEGISRELSGSGVRVTYVAPRAIRTADRNGAGDLKRSLPTSPDSAKFVASEIWCAIHSDKRQNFPRLKERPSSNTQRLLRSLTNRVVGVLFRDPPTP